MNIFHDIGPDDGMQIGLHEIEDEVDVFIIFCFEDTDEADDVGMAVELLEEDDLHGWLGTSR